MPRAGIPLNGWLFRRNRHTYQFEFESYEMKCNADTATGSNCPHNHAMQEVNVNVQNHTNVYQHDGMTEDLAILSRWVKKELFVKVKFLYNPEINLMIGGKIYNMFLGDCKDRLVGLKLLAASDSACRNRYAQALWSQATKGKRRNLISDGLNTRRSSIYSATQNRFNGKKMMALLQLISTRYSLVIPILLGTELCSLCVQKYVVFPSLEAFEEGVQLPCVYMLFHDYFLKSSVGDAAWKEACLDAADPTAPIAPPQAQAFAMLLLRNNYFAWLWEAKLEYRTELKTDYDMVKDRCHAVEISDGILQCQINLNVDEEDEDNWSKILVKKDDNPVIYNSLKKASDALIKQVRQSARNNDKYKAFRTGVEPVQLEEDDNSPTENSEVPAESIHAKRTKKRKVLQGFREYTNPKDDEGKFKGWSTRAKTDMNELMEALNKPISEQEKIFRKLYRFTYKKKQGASVRKRAIPPDASGPNDDVQIWGLEGIPEVAL